MSVRLKARFGFDIFEATVQEYTVVVLVVHIRARRASIDTSSLYLRARRIG